ncbi:hypothetical protein LSUE1_G007408 [Lachnellula suecica]|uniref:Uncharacterized protein n=1 Tax=Lachnellula suecica TaxID=602035 RepID=A0A8T9C6X0_9HELO|nr:hypothetical protein LSUE1_G007408 [Lachnellula suecica]
MANQLLLAPEPQEKLAFIILFSFRYTRLIVYIIGCWTFNLLSGFLVILKTKTTTQVSILPLLPHAIPFLLLFGISKLSESVDDPAPVWFVALAVGRYFRLFVNLYSFWRYKPASLPTIRTISPKDVTMILPTVSVSESENPDFEECLTACLLNKPASVIIATDTYFKVTGVNKQLLSIRDKIERGSSNFLSELGPTDISGVDVQVTYTGVANKRCQMTHAIPYVQTRLVMFLDDHVFLPRSFLDSVVPVFENPCVGLCGTKKAVRRKHPEAHSLWGRYWELFWNVMGALYLERHNFEIRATNAMDGGVFVVGKVYMQGGYSISTEGIPIPRDDAANNKHFDWPAAERFHPRLENIPSDVYTKVATYATNIPASIFNDLGNTKHPIGKDLQNRYQRQGVQFYKTACGPKPVNGITQEKFLHNLSSFYEKHPPGKQTSEKGTPLPEDGTPLPDPDTDEIIPYLTKGLMYDALAALGTGGGNLVDALGVLNTESMANQTSIHKVIGTPKQDDLPANPNIHPERMAFVISTILKGGLYDSAQNGPGSQLKE